MTGSQPREATVVKKALLFGSAAIAAGSAIALLRPRSTIDLRGKVILITGGSRGLGFAMAREFAARGSHLILCARNAEELDVAKRDLAGAEGRIVTLPCDVRNREQVAELIANAVSEFGHIDVLVNNAGAISVGPVDTMNIQDFEDAMDVMFWDGLHNPRSSAALAKERRRPNREYYHFHRRQSERPAPVAL
jgi:NAD(P)-dependent dehydrogenase (short-subunit alcohol dehydrogenase family)